MKKPYNGTIEIELDPISRAEHVVPEVLLPEYVVPDVLLRGRMPLSYQHVVQGTTHSYHTFAQASGSYYLFYEIFPLSFPSKHSIH
jgi:hypothetical protein